MRKDNGLRSENTTKVIPGTHFWRLHWRKKSEMLGSESIQNFTYIPETKIKIQPHSHENADYRKLF